MKSTKLREMDGEILKKREIREILKAKPIRGCTKTWDWGWGTVTLNMQPCMCLNGPVVVQTYVLLRLCGTTWKLSLAVAHHPSVWLNWSYFPKKSDQRQPTLQVQSWWRKTADRLAALIAVKCGSTASNTRHFLDVFVPYCFSCIIFLPPHTYAHCFVTISLKCISFCGNNVTRCGIVQGVWILFEGTVYVGAGFCFLSQLLQPCTSFPRSELCILVREEGSLSVFCWVFCSENRWESKTCWIKGQCCVQPSFLRTHTETCRLHNRISVEKKKGNYLMGSAAFNGTQHCLEKLTVNKEEPFYQDHCFFNYASTLCVLLFLYPAKL